MDDALLGYIGKKVAIKVDPYDVSSIYVINGQGKSICRAYAQDLLQFGKVSDETLQTHRKRQNKQLKAVREAVEEANIPFDGDTEGAHKGMVGGVKLTIGKDAQKKSKVVAMPQDRVYRQNPDIRKKSEYMNSQAQKALEKLRAIGEA